MPKATIADVARQAGLSISTVNRAIHEPNKVRDDTIRAVLHAAEKVGFYGIGSIKDSLRTARPRIRIGIMLLQSNRVLYKTMNTLLRQAAGAVASHEVVIRIEHLEELSPQNVSDKLKAMSGDADVIGVVSTEHPVVASTIEALAEQQIKTFALISPLTARCNVGYIGIDNWKVGRTAAWAITNMCRAPDKVAILVGNHRYRCQETSESGFRSYFREHPSGFEILDAQSTFETASIAQEITEEIIEKHPDLLALYCDGGGISGVCAALRGSGKAKDIVLIGHDLTEVTRAALLDGTINFLLSQPLPALGAETIAAMIRAHDGGPDFPPQSISLPFEIYTAENL